jgi:5'-nucleotidase
MTPESEELEIVDAVTPDAVLLETVIAPLQLCKEALAEPFSETEIVINRSREGSAPFVNGVRTGETNAGNLTADAFLATYDALAADFGLPPRDAANPVIAVQNGGGIRQNGGNFIPADGVAPGPISRVDTQNMLAFLTNLVTVVSEVSPEDVKEIFERSASGLPGAAGQFLQVGGMMVVYDVAGTAQQIDLASGGDVIVPGSRVVDVLLDDGTFIVRNGAVEPGAPNVRIVTNSFTADGGDAFAAFRDNPNKLQLGLSYEQSLVDYLATFPSTGLLGLPTVDAADPRYQPDGEGRITIVSGSN